MLNEKKNRRAVAAPVDVSSRLAEAKVSLQQLAGPQVTVSFHVGTHASRVGIESARLEQLLGQLAVHARNALPRGGHLTLETLSLDLDERGTPWHPGLPPGSWVMLVATEAVSPDWRLSHVSAPPASVFNQHPDLTLAGIEALVHESGGILNTTATPGGGLRLKIYFRRLAPASVRELKQAV